MQKTADDIFPAWPWPTATSPTAPIHCDEIQVWLANLRPSAQRLANLAALLTPDERERAGRLRFPEHQERFIAGRGLLRELLGAYLDRPASALRFEQGPRGKPVVAGADRGADLHFNLSHSGDGALYAIARRAVGVDVECCDRTLNFAAVLERVCTPREWALFQAQPPTRERDAFFTCWTRKEAAAKALGDGLASGLRNLEVCWRDGAPAEGRCGFADAIGREWSVMNLALGPGWSGAVAAVGADWWWRGWRLREPAGLSNETVDEGALAP